MRSFIRFLGIVVALAFLPLGSARAQVPGGGVLTYCYTGSGPLTVLANWTGCPSTGSGGSVTANQGNAGTNAQGWWTRIGDGTNGPVAVKPASTAAAAADLSLVVNVSPNCSTTVCITTGTFGSPSTQVVSVQGPATGGGFPTAATAITGNATGSVGAVVGTLAAASSVTTYICGFNVSAVGGTAAIGPITVAGLTGSSQVYQMNSAATPVMLTQSFNPCIPASAQNTPITITTTANVAATAVDVNSWGYRQ